MWSLILISLVISYTKGAPINKQEDVPEVNSKSNELHPGINDVVSESEEEPKPVSIPPRFKYMEHQILNNELGGETSSATEWSSNSNEELIADIEEIDDDVIETEFEPNEVVPEVFKTSGP